MFCFPALQQGKGWSFVAVDVWFFMFGVVCVCVFCVQNKAT